MNTQNLRTLFPTVTKQKILNLSYGEGEHYTVLPMIAQKEDTFYLWEISAMSEQEYEHRNRTYKEAKTNRAELKQNLEEADQVPVAEAASKQHHSSALFFAMRPDTQTGPMGYKNRVCQLEAMEEGFEGEISVEIFLCHKTIPGEEKKARH